MRPAFCNVSMCLSHASGSFSQGATWASDACLRLESGVAARSAGDASDVNPPAREWSSPGGPDARLHRCHCQLSQPACLGSSRPVKASLETGRTSLRPAANVAAWLAQRLAPWSPQSEGGAAFSSRAPDRVQPGRLGLTERSFSDFFTSLWNCGVGAGAAARG